jgi:hypothetical protein
MGGFHHALRVGWHQVIRIFCADYLGRTRETTRLGFDWADISPCLILWRGTYPGWLSPPNDDPGSTQILTRHCSVQS